MANETRRNDVGGKAVISVCILVIAGLFSWFISASWGQGTKAQEDVECVKKDVSKIDTRVSVHDEKFATIDRRFDTVITKQNSMEGKIDLLLAK